MHTGAGGREGFRESQGTRMKRKETSFKKLKL